MKLTINLAETFTMKALARALTEKFGTKTTGKEFNIQDVQQYVAKGKLPSAYGGNDVEKIEHAENGLLLFKVKGFKDE